MSVLVETTVGDLVFDLYTEERPRSSLNFLKLCKIKYYNYCLFHSVRRNFIAQCGDPTGTGRGGESIYSYIYGDQAKYFDLEVKPRIKHKTRGTISFVNNGNDKHGSQFFITMGEGLDFLDGKHTIFGRLSEGFDTLELLNETICDDTHKPYQDVRITHTIILYDPYDDPKGLMIPDRSPEPTREQLESGRIGADEDVNEKGKSKEEIQRKIEDKELQIGTKILETVGDIKNTEEKPPENVLFVCKLNPVTNAEDLKIIFSRFGKIRSCEIVKDYKTGDSLCYGFVEFKEVESCEKAYFKMDNVLIDDRRIHVDFCQSVAKVKKWHKSMSYQKSTKENPPQEVYETKGNRSTKKEKEKYSMVFEEEQIVPVKQKKKEQREQIKEKQKKKYESETDDEKTPLKKTAEKKSKNQVTKEVRRRKKSTTSASDSEEERIKITKPKKKPAEIINREKLDLKKRGKRERVESESSSDEHDKLSKKEKKKRNEEKEIDNKIEELRSAKKRKEKKSKPLSEDSDDEPEERERVKTKTTKKKKSLENNSDSDVENSKARVKKTKKEKYPEKKKKKVYDSDEGEEKTNRSDKQKGNTKKGKPVRSKQRTVEDSDTEDYAEPEEKHTSSKKRRSVSSNESSEEERKPTKTQTSNRRGDSSDDDHRKKSSRKKITNKKKTRRRHDSSNDSDSSE